MAPASIGDPFALATYTRQKRKASSSKAKDQAHVSVAHSPGRRTDGCVTVTVQQEGLHVLDLSDLHPIVSHSLGPSTTFACASSTRLAPDRKALDTYSVVTSAPDVPQDAIGKTIWCIHGDADGSTSKRCSAVLPHKVARLYTPAELPECVLCLSPEGDWTVTDNDLRIKATCPALPSQSSSRLLHAFALPAGHCKFLPSQAALPDAVTLVTVFNDSRIRVVLITCQGADVLDLGGYSLPTQKGETCIDASCSSSGWISILTQSGKWSSYQLVASSTSAVLTQSLDVTTPVPALQLSLSLTFSASAFSTTSTSLLALNSSHVLLASLSPKAEISILLWDLQYGVLLASQSVPLPNALAEDAGVSLKLASATDSQSLLVLSGEARSVVLAVPITVPSTSTIAAAMGRADAAKRYLASTSSSELTVEDGLMEAERELLDSLAGASDAGVLKTTFFNWIRAQKEDPKVQGDLRGIPHLGWTFVKALLDLLLLPQKSAPVQVKAARNYSGKVAQYILERRVVSSSMVDGGLLRALKAKNDWTSIKLAFNMVLDLSEDEIISLLQPFASSPDNAMDVDSKDNTPALATVLGWVITYTARASAAPMRLAIRQHIPGAEELTKILVLLDGWVVHYASSDPQLVTSGRNVKGKDKLDMPPLDNVLSFAQILLDSSFLALLQHRPAHQTLRSLLEHLGPELALVDVLQQLCAPLEPFAAAQKRNLAKKDKSTAREKEKDVDWRRKKREAREKANMAVCVYQVEELVL